MLPFFATAVNPTGALSCVSCNGCWPSGLRNRPLLPLASCAYTTLFVDGRLQSQDSGSILYGSLPLSQFWSWQHSLSPEVDSDGVPCVFYGGLWSTPCCTVLSGELLAKSQIDLNQLQIYGAIAQGVEALPAK